MQKDSSKKTAVVKTRYGSFTAVFEIEPDMGGFVVTVPKIQGAVSWGKNLTKAKRMIVEAIEGLIENYQTNNFNPHSRREYYWAKTFEENY